MSTNPEDHTRLRNALGLYVLGALSEAEVAVVESHLAHCRRCLDECGRLGEIPGYLDALDNPDAAGLRPGGGQA